MEKQDRNDKASLQVNWVDMLKAWAIYFLLKCTVVLSANCIGELLGFLTVSVEKGPGLQEGVEMAWVALAVYYATVAVIAAFLFKWAVGRFVVSKIVQEEPVHLSLFLYCRAWLVYASITFGLGYLITLLCEYTIFDLMLGSLAEAPSTGWVRKSVRPSAFTLVSLLVFRWTVIKLLLADRIAPASPKSPGT